MRKGYQQTPNEMSGYKTLVTPSGEKGLPSRTDKKKDQNYRDRPGVPSNNSYKEQALPITPKHEKRRDQRMVQKNGPAYNTPPDSGKAPGGKSLNKDRARTKGEPGEEYGHPYLDQGPAGMKGRRPLQGGLQEPFPRQKQREQGGEAKRYYEKDYRENRTKKRNDARRRYERLKSRSNFKLDRERRKKFPGRFERKPGGYRDPSDRARDWREEREGGLWSGDDFVLYRGNPSQDSETYYDRGQGAVKWQQKQDERRKRLPNSYPYGFVDDNPGSAKVIPEGHDFKNKDQREPKRAALRWRDLSYELREALGALIRTPLWKRYTKLQARDRDVVEYLNQQGVPITVREWKELIPQLGHMKLAARISDIEARCEPGIFSRARGLKPKIRKVNARHGIWTYDVKGSKPKPYTVKVQMFRKGNIRNVQKLDIHASCSCPYWRWQGPEHHAKVHGYLYGQPRGTASVPVIMDPSNIHGACKHVLAVFSHIKKIGTLHRNWKKQGSTARSRYFPDSFTSDENLILGAQRVSDRYLRRILQAQRRT